MSKKDKKASSTKKSNNAMTEEMCKHNTEK